MPIETPRLDERPFASRHGRSSLCSAMDVEFSQFFTGTALKQDITALKPKKKYIKNKKFDKKMRDTKQYIIITPKNS